MYRRRGPSDPRTTPRRDGGGSGVEPEGIVPPPQPIASTLEQDVPAEDRGTQPAVAGGDRDVAVATPPEDPEVDLLGACVDDPVFGDPGPVIGVAQRPGVLRH